MNTLILTVTGMSCMGCVNSVKNLISPLPGVGGVRVELASGRVEVDHDPALCDTASISQSIRDAGYGVTE